MAFEIKKTKIEDLDRIYPDNEADQINRFTVSKRSYPVGRGGNTWAIDEEKNAFLTMIPAGREEYLWRYMFGYEKRIVIIKKVGYCLFSFLYVSEPLIPRLEEVKEIIRAAFKASGTMIDGTVDEKDCDAVPDAQFTPWPNEGERS